MKILVVDDDEVTRNLLTEVLAKEKFEIKQAASGEAALKILAKENFSIILSDIRMLDVDGMAILSHVKKNAMQTIVILMTGFGNLEGAVKAIQEGAFDYISKPFKMQDLKQLVLRAAAQWKILYESKTEKGAITPAKENFTAKTLLGKSPLIVDVYKNLARASISSSSILITGESGTGKELVARAIHENSSRRTKKFLAVNCGALLENLLESELFGHIKGSFTGAANDKRGLFEEANGGTLFLDEIGDISAAMQVKLLRALQEGEIKPVGANESKKVDVRIIAATHRGLDHLVKENKFREDLLYRLKVIEIHLPALRDRMEDLPELVNHFLAMFAEKNNKKISHISDEAMKKLYHYKWPGNVRELEHAIERAIAMTNGTILFPEDFPAEIFKQDISADGASTTDEDTTKQSLDDMEKQHILRVLKDVQFNKSKAAEVLGIDRATLYRKAQKYGIDLKTEK